jgi:hypothetical protein
MYDIVNVPRRCERVHGLALRPRKNVQCAAAEKSPTTSTEPSVRTASLSTATRHGRLPARRPVARSDAGLAGCLHLRHDRRRHRVRRHVHGALETGWVADGGSGALSASLTWAVRPGSLDASSFLSDPPQPACVAPESGVASALSCKLATEAVATDRYQRVHGTIWAEHSALASISTIGPPEALCRSAHHRTIWASAIVCRGNRSHSDAYLGRSRQ